MHQITYVQLLFRAIGTKRDNLMKAARPLCIQNATGQAQDEYSLFVVGK